MDSKKVMTITADLVDPSDLSMNDTNSLRSPRLPSAGIIGQPSPGLLPPESYVTYPTSRSRTPISQDPNDLDLASLIAQAHKQHEIDKAHASQIDTYVNHDATNGGMGEFRRRREEDIWDRLSHKSSNGHGSIPSPMPNSMPHSAPLHQFQPFSDSRLGPTAHHAHTISTPCIPAQPSPIRAGVPIGVDASAQLAHHLMAISSIINPLLKQADEVDKLKMEVEMLRGEWFRVEAERKRIENMLILTQSPKVRIVYGGFY